MPTTAPIPLTLSQLKPGERCRVLSVAGQGPIFQRLLEMGFVPGTTIRMVRFAPLGDPVQVEVGDYHLSLRRAEASTVLVAREA